MAASDDTTRTDSVAQRRAIVAAARRIVVKIGTRPLTSPSGTLDEARLGRLADELHQILTGGRQVVLVSSGAVGAGMGLLGLTRRPSDLSSLQAVAAIGQSYLVQAYERALRRHGRHAAQILLTADDVNHRQRYLHVRNTLTALLEMGAVPIINENDTVSVEELRTTFGDNDRLAACVTNLLRAPLLILLSDVEGLYDGDPADPDAKLVPRLAAIDAAALALVRDRATGLSKGGMASKLHAARIVTAAGENVIIANGRRDGVLTAILAGEEVGTLIPARGASVAARKRWIGQAARPEGHLVVDEGARRAVEAGGKSLLPIGVVECVGHFEEGDLIGVRDARGDEFARGLTNFSSIEVQRIKGLRSETLASVLGYRACDEVIHRDNLALTK